MANYTGVKCPVCNKRFTEDDDIVVCPVCGAPMTMNLRCDNTFVQDEGWYQAADRYAAFLRRHERGRVLYLELGVGYNTPGIIKYPFWQRTLQNPQATYVCLNEGQAAAPQAIAGQSLCLDGDIGEILTAVQAIPRRKEA